MWGCLWDNTVRLDRCRSRLASLVTAITMKKCTNFINKVRESRFSQVRDKQVNKFHRLGGKDRDRDLITQPPANSTQLPAQTNSNKWVINLFSIPLSQAQESLLAKRPNYVVAPKNSPHLEYITSNRISLPKFRPSGGQGTQGRHQNSGQTSRVLRISHPPKPNLTKADLQALSQLKDSNRIV